MNDTWTVWGDEKEPLLVSISEEDAKEYIMGATFRNDLYMQNDRTGTCLSFDGENWVKE